LEAHALECPACHRARAQAGQVEGLYLSPILPDAAAYTESVVRDLASRYDLDGVHLDYLRYPSDDFDYSRYAIDRFRDEVRPTLAPSGRPWRRPQTRTRTSACDGSA
jgi:uncharacterized lipoprotein YddW (UPF0748 family)